MSFDAGAIEEKWQKRWNEEDLFASDPDDREKFYINFAYAYPSGGMHIGHVRTDTISDIIARFKRMQGFNVLFPTGWHVTGTPIIGAVERLKEQEEEQLYVLQDVYNVPDDALAEMETPEGFAQYFINEYRDLMQRLGFTIDWRRDIWTSDPHYTRFITWQYHLLKEKGFLKEGLHPVKYCINDESPVTAHDLLEGEGADRNEYTLILFETDYNGSAKVPMATLRPETVFGVTNIFVNPDATYVTADVDGETWILSEESAEKLSHQHFAVNIGETIDGADLVGRGVKNPVTEETVPVLPAAFVDPDNASGVVMSVPAHAPVDYVALQEAKRIDYTKFPNAPDDFAKKVENIEPVSIISSPSFDTVPAREVVEKYNISTQEDEKLEKATEEVYSTEHHKGKMTVETYEGMPVQEMEAELQDAFGEHLSSMYDFAEAVVCRCGGKVVVAEADSWFLTYNDPHWQEEAITCLDQLDVVPPKMRNEFVHAIEWLEEWPCIRNYGLGTKLPFDERFIIEPLSDSTIYMAFFTIAHRLQEYDAEQLTDTFFDYVFRGEGNAETVGRDTGIATSAIEEMRDEFTYWYPLDYNCSANDLVQNHLVFYLFHHAALFPEEHWPRGNAVWGMGLLEGEKMSSSKGHVVPARKAIETYGADVVRFYLFANWDPWQDFDWREGEVRQQKKHLERWFERCEELYGVGEERDLQQVDRWLRSRLQSIIEETTERLEQFETRKAALAAFFTLNKHLDWYRQRVDVPHAQVLQDVIETQIRLLAPFTPHLAEELWEKIGRDGFVTEADWPLPNEEKVNGAAEHGEELIKETLEDAREVAGLVEEFGTVRIIVAPHWKYAAFDHILSLETREMGEIMASLKEDHAKHMEELQAVVRRYVENPNSLGPIATQEIEKGALEDAEDFLARELDADIVIETADESDANKAGRAEPGTPAIVLE